MTFACSFTWAWLQFWNCSFTYSIMLFLNFTDSRSIETRKKGITHSKWPCELSSSSCIIIISPKAKWGSITTYWGCRSWISRQFQVRENCCKYSTRLIILWQVSANLYFASLVLVYLWPSASWRKQSMVLMKLCPPVNTCWSYGKKFMRPSWKGLYYIIFFVQYCILFLLSVTASTTHLKLLSSTTFVFFCSEQRGTGLLDRVATSHRSLVQLHLTELSDRDSGIRMLQTSSLLEIYAMFGFIIAVTKNQKYRKSWPNLSITEHVLSGKLDSRPPELWPDVLFVPVGSSLVADREAKVMFLHVFVSHSVHWGGRCIPSYNWAECVWTVGCWMWGWGGWLDRGVYTALPHLRGPLPRSVRILLECIPVYGIAHAK